ncbi:MAG: S8 family serine peptidase, partial [Gemmatimonadota bacterium]
MKAFRLVPALLVLVTVSACEGDRPAPMAPGPSMEARQPSPEMLDRYLVEYSGDVAKLAAAVKAAGGDVGRIHDNIGVLEVEGMAAGDIMALPGVQHATPDAVFHGLPIAIMGYRLDDAPFTPSPMPADAYFFDCQWDLQQIRAEEAWAAGARGAGQKIALLDTGVDEDHVDLVGRIDLAQSVNLVTWHDGACPEEDATTRTDYNSHGTGNAAEIASNNIGVAGLLPDGQTVNIKVATCTGDGSLADFLAGLLYAADLDDVSVLSISLYYPVKRGEPGSKRYIAMMQKAVDYVTQQGKLIIGTAANDGINLSTLKDSVYIPTTLANVRSAYATNHLDQLAPYSNYGVSGTWVGGPGGQDWE